jgi:DnaK suppressor protein
MDQRDDLDLKAIKKALERERADILEVSASSADERRPVELDQQSVGRLSRMDAMQVQAMAQAVEARRRGRLQLIDAALRRLAEGDYGFCTECDVDIPAKRLAIDPTTARCVDCAG